MAAKLAIIGAGDLGKTLLKLLSDIPTYNFAGFLDDTLAQENGKGKNVLGAIDDAKRLQNEGAFDAAILAIGYNHMVARQQIFEDMSRSGIRLAKLIHPTACIANDSRIEHGSVIFPGCTIDVGARIGRNTVINAGAVVSHDTSIGSHCFIGPGSVFAGFAHTGERCRFGVGCIIHDNIRISDDCQVASASLVTHDVPPGQLVMGTPAKFRRKVEWLR
ncbi:acetyltransferase [Rhodopirellula sp. P2]|uniref:acetyltransferase n=1 Tax=Rhodopirellula sp. P2 TaxID=2127060 RepID=UPI0023688837|nr:acetyltransferase [Rhodopirellula sp. P2]WDQ15650.1 acetyltransferase [Rhodopirellula sp. P2]